MGPLVRSRSLAAALALLAAACSERKDEAPLEATTSLFALVETIDGTAFYPPLGPQPVITGAFDASQLAHLRVALEATSASGAVSTVATFDSSTRPALALFAPFEVYMVNVPAAAYFTDASLAYRFRALLDGVEIGRSDLSGVIFQILPTNPTLTVGVKLRIELRAAPVLTAISPDHIGPGGGDLTLTLSGRAFVRDSVARLDGQDLATTHVSDATLTAVVPAALVATAGTHEVVVATPAPGGGTSGAERLTVENPAPTLVALTPGTVVSGSGAFTLTVDGTSFVSGAVVTFAGADLATTFVSATRLTAAVPGAAIAAAGSYAVTARNAEPSLGPSGALTFVATNLTPFLTSIAPTSAIAGAAAFTLTLNGSSFLPGASASFGGTPLVTTYVSATRLTAVVPAASVAAGGTYAVLCANPAPSAGTTAPQSFVVTALPAGLVHWWTAENDALDQVTGSVGTLGTTTFATGHAGQAFEFNGTNYVSLPTDTATLSLRQGTVSLWFRILTLSSNTVRLFEVAQSGPAFPAAGQWTLDYRGFSPGQLQVSCFSGGSGLLSTFTPSGSVTNTAFHHVAVVADGVGPLVIYIDGVAQSLSSGATSRFFGHAANLNNMKIGAIQRDTIASEGSKTIDDVRIYSRPLTAAEVQTLYLAP